MSDRWKRILAFILDWALTLLPVLLISVGINQSLSQEIGSALLVFSNILLIIICFCGILLRDVLWGGRSLGKRMLGLYVYDSRTLEPASVRQRISRSLFIFFVPFDVLFLIITGVSLGDRSAGTAVLSDSSLEQFKMTRGSRNSPGQITLPRTIRSKSILIIVGILVLAVAVFVAAILGIVLSVLDSTKDTEEYQLAYDYLVGSNAFAETGADASDVTLNQYSHTSYTSNGCGAYHNITEFGFLVNDRSFTVVLHEARDHWVVCENCTEFE